MKIIIICAEGSMGKSLASAILEKFNFINLVVRKRYLNDYVTDLRPLSDNSFKKRTLEISRELSKADVAGGLGVINQIKDSKNKKIHLEKIKKDLKIFKDTRYVNLDKMFFDSMLIFNKATIYKKKIINPIGAIENSKDISKFQINSIYNGYNKYFKDYHFIFLNREFVSWLNSIASQIISKNFINIFKYRMRLSAQVKRYKKWQIIFKSKNKNTTKIQFDEFFNEKKFINLIKKISKKLKIEVPKIDFKRENYDCFGYLASYEKAFNKIDDNIDFLSNISKKISMISYRLNNKFLIILLDIIFQILFLTDVFKFKIKRILKKI